MWVSGFSWDRLNFLPYCWYSAEFWTPCEANVDNDVLVVAKLRLVKDFSVSHSAPEQFHKKTGGECTQDS